MFGQLGLSERARVQHRSDLADRVIDEVSARERVVLSRALMPDRHMRCGARTDDEGKKFAGP
jgi:hypothetical protein